MANTLFIVVTLKKKVLSIKGLGHLINFYSNNVIGSGVYNLRRFFARIQTVSKETKRGGQVYNRLLTIFTFYP
jgi:hypothetical protein